MNLELLFHASKVTGDESFRKVAIAHAEKVMQNQVRKDYSCFHIIYYDKETGKPIKGETSQDIPTIRLGRADKPGAFTDLPCVTVRRKTSVS